MASRTTHKQRDERVHLLLYTTGRGVLSSLVTVLGPRLGRPAARETCRFVMQARILFHINGEWAGDKKPSSHSSKEKRVWLRRPWRLYG
jgi:hypothetical protein